MQTIALVLGVIGLAIGAILSQSPVVFGGLCLLAWMGICAYLAVQATPSNYKDGLADSGIAAVGLYTFYCFFWVSIPMGERAEPFITERVAGRTENWKERGRDKELRCVQEAKAGLLSRAPTMNIIAIGEAVEDLVTKCSSVANKAPGNAQERGLNPSGRAR